MTYFLYVPIAEKDVPLTLKKTIKGWVEAENKKQAVVTYLGEKGLKNLPPYAKIYVVAPGSATEPNSIEREASYETAFYFQSLHQQFYLSQGPRQRLFVPKIAEDMIADGLFSETTDQEKVSAKNIRIKLFFLNAGKQASRLAGVFQYILNQKKPEEAHARIDYYHGELRVPGNEPHEYAKRNSKNRASFYSNEDCKPALTREQVADALQKYNTYKSSRFCGLSGFFGLNGLCSSNESRTMIRNLLSGESDEYRCSIAQKFVKQFPNNKLAEYLKEKVSNSKEENNMTFWTLR